MYSLSFCVLRKEFTEEVLILLEAESFLENVSTDLEFLRQVLFFFLPLFVYICLVSVYLYIDVFLFYMPVSSSFLFYNGL